MKTYDVAIIGAGPYGLSAAVHLRAANGLNIRLFGQPMSFWEHHMPTGMLLRSPWEGSHIADPNGALTLDAFRSMSGNHLAAPIPLDRFIEYGHWFQRQGAPEVDRRTVERVDSEPKGFRLILEDGEIERARRVVIAAGIVPFAWCPPQFEHLPSSLASHSCDHRDLRRFAGQRVVVVGGGQSALESAALLHEAGADVEVIIRAASVRWLWQRPWLHTFKPVSRLLYAPPDVGPAGVSHLVARPSFFRRLPRRFQDRLDVRSVRPAGSAWLRPRLSDVPLTTGRSVISAAPVSGRLRITLNDGTERHIDHALLATGYRIDISRYSFLSSELLASIRQIDGCPVLDDGFESSVPGLHFLGAPAAWSFGPLMRFVAGTQFATLALTHRITSKSSKDKATKTIYRSDDQRNADTPANLTIVGRARANPMESSANLITPSAGLARLEPKTSTLASKPTPVKKYKPGCAGALVMGADYRALGVVRSLGRRGIPVWVLKRDGELLAATSRYVRRSLAWPAGDEARRVKFLMELSVEYGLSGWMLFPSEDASVGLVARNHDSLSKSYQLSTPPWETLQWICNKRLMYGLAQKLGIDQPWTFCPCDRRDLMTRNCRFPVILKPAVREVFNRFTAAKAWRVDDHASLLARYDEACTLIPPEIVMIQEVVPGWGEAQFSYSALCADGQPLAAVVAKRVRQYPMDFGRASTYVETVDEPHLVEPAVRLLAALRYTGLIEVEFKRDPRDGGYKLLDVNPRVWGWHTLCSRAGVDFPYLLWLLLHGEPTPEVRARTGVRWVRMSTDFPTALLEILRGRLSIVAYTRSLRGPLESAIFASDDPWPGMLELPLIAYMLGKRVLRGSGI